MEYTEQQWADMRRWVNQWKETGPLLEQIKADELASMTDQQAIESFNALDVDHALIWRSPEREKACGFIEQQRFFKKAHCFPRDHESSL